MRAKGTSGPILKQEVTFQYFGEWRATLGASRGVGLKPAAIVEGIALFACVEHVHICFYVRCFLMLRER